MQQVQAGHAVISLILATENSKMTVPYLRVICQDLSEVISKIMLQIYSGISLAFASFKDPLHKIDWPRTQKWPEKGPEK